MAVSISRATMAWGPSWLTTVHSFPRMARIVAPRGRVPADLRTFVT